jgi:hypothetical protein
MALSFPLGISVFADVLISTGFRWQLQRYIVTSGTAGGDIITREVSAPKWTAPVPLDPMLQVFASRIQSLIEAAEGQGSDGTFYLYDLRKAGPRMDRSGSIVGNRVCSIISMGASNAEITIGGLPNNYVMSAGDMFSIQLGSGRRALHRSTDTVVAGPGGTLPTFGVVPPLRVGTAAGQRCTFYKPIAECMVLPGSFTAGTAEGRFVTGMFFTAIEV